MNPLCCVEGSRGVYVGACEPLLGQLLPKANVVVVVDRQVRRLYPWLVATDRVVVIDGGEEHKTMQTIERICRQFVEMGVDRSTFVLGIGGGVVTDMTGFAASIYMRGLRFGFVSTTLLGEVDASVGGKNGVNLDGYKNMMGTFNQPEFVVCDPALLCSLSKRMLRAGLAEAIKTAIIGDVALFECLEQSSFEMLRADTDLLSYIVSACIRLKSRVVSQDLRETGLRRLLNLGHTFAHAIEKCSHKMTHGEAVAVGLHLIADLAVRMGRMKRADRDRIERLLRRYGFDLELPVPLYRLVDAASKDKKREAGALHLVVPEAIGRCEVVDLSLAEFSRLLLAE